MQNKPYPSKTTMNLAARREGAVPRRVLLASLAAAVLFLTLFGVYGVASPLARVGQAEEALSLAQAEKASLEGTLAGFRAVGAEYDRYTQTALPQEYRQLASRADMLSLLENVIMPACRVRSAAVEDNLMSVELEGISLQAAAGVVDRLYEEDGVEQVDIYSVNTGTTEEPVQQVSMLITMKADPEGGGQE